MDRLRALLDHSFSAKLKEDLRTASIWARLVTVFSFITTAFVVIQNIALGNYPFAIVAVLVNVVTGIYLFNFGHKSKKGIETTDQLILEEGLNSLRLYFKAMVIIISICVGFALVVAFVSLFSS